MIKGIVMLCALWGLACHNNKPPDTLVVLVKPAVNPAEVKGSDTVRIRLDQSVIAWTATEMRGARTRTGVISFQEGYLLCKGRSVTGGYFAVNMHTIDLTDIPAYEKIARKNVLNHLKSEDFFDVARYPLAEIRLTEVRNKGTGLRVSGNLTIRGITKNIDFQIQRTGDLFVSDFAINRLDWNIAYEGSWAAKTLVDKKVMLNIKIKADYEFL